MADATDIEQMRHALGVQLKAGKWTAPYRNHFVAGEADEPRWRALEQAGLARQCAIAVELSGGAPCFAVTERGRDVALTGLPLLLSANRSKCTMRSHCR